MPFVNQDQYTNILGVKRNRSPEKCQKVPSPAKSEMDAKPSYAYANFEPKISKNVSLDVKDYEQLYNQ